MITLEQDMEKYINKYKYMVVFPDKKVELFSIGSEVSESSK